MGTLLNFPLAQIKKNSFLENPDSISIIPHKFCPACQAQGRNPYQNFSAIEKNFGKNSIKIVKCMGCQNK